jgi:hypothetical protein
MVAVGFVMPPHQANRDARAQTRLLRRFGIDGPLDGLATIR